MRDEHCQPNNCWHGGFLDCYVFGIQFQQAHAAGEKDADDAQYWESIDLAGLLEIPQSIGDREGEGNNYTPGRPKIFSTAEFAEDNNRDDNVERKVA